MTLDNLSDFAVVGFFVCIVMFGWVTYWCGILEDRIKVLEKQVETTTSRRNRGSNERNTSKKTTPVGDSL